MIVFVSFASVLLSTVVLFVGVNLLAALQIRDRIWISALAAACYALVISASPVWWLAGDIAVIAFALVAGMLIGNTLRSRIAIVTFCVVAAVVDVLSVSGGITHTIVESYRSGRSDLLINLTIAVPVRDSIRPIVGIGDLIILASLFSGFNRLKHRGLWQFAAPASGLAIALGVGLAIGGAPALPFISGTTLIYVFVRSRGARAVRDG